MPTIISFVVPADAVAPSFGSPALVSAQNLGTDSGGFPELGVDSSTYPDLDEGFSTIAIEVMIAQICLRRLSTKNGSLPGDLAFGLDLRDFLNTDLDAAKLGQLSASIEGQLLLDERIEAVEVATTVLGNALRVRIEGTTAAGPFSFTLLASQASVDLLEGG